MKHPNGTKVATTQDNLEKYGGLVINDEYVSLSDTKKALKPANDDWKKIFLGPNGMLREATDAELREIFSTYDGKLKPNGDLTIDAKKGLVTNKGLDVVQPSVDKTNEILVEYHGLNSRLFDVVRDAYFLLKDNENLLTIYKTAVNIDRSTINKIIHFVEKDFIIELQHKLPSGWSALYQCSLFKEDVLRDLVERCQITKTTSVSKIKELRTGKKPEATDSQDDGEYNFLNVDWDTLHLKSKDEKRVVELLDELRSYGFEVWDGNEEDEEPIPQAA